MKTVTTLILTLALVTTAQAFDPRPYGATGNSIYDYSLNLREDSNRRHAARQRDYDSFSNDLRERARQYDGSYDGSMTYQRRLDD